MSALDFGPLILGKKSLILPHSGPFSNSYEMLQNFAEEFRVLWILLKSYDNNILAIPSKNNIIIVEVTEL